MPVYRTTRRIEFRDTDAAGITHFSAFFNFMEEAEHEFLRSLGLSVMMHDAEGKLSWPRVSVRCDFQTPVKFEDVVDIDVQVVRLGEKSVTYGLNFTHEGRPVAKGQIAAVCCRMHHEDPPVSIPIPEWIAAKLRE